MKPLLYLVLFLWIGTVVFIQASLYFFSRWMIASSEFARRCAAASTSGLERLNGHVRGLIERNLS